MKVSEGMRGRVMIVWQNINSPFFTDEEKGEGQYAMWWCYVEGGNHE